MVICFEFCHRERASLFFVKGQPMGSLGHRYGSECQIEVVFQFGFVGALAMGKPGKLLGVTEDELDLETQGVSFQNPGPVFFGVGTEIKFVALD